jgi:hypothetical protein
MTSPDDFTDDVEQVTEHVLGDLRPDDRLALAIEAQAAGDEAHVQRLKDTAEWRTYRQPTKEFQDALQHSLLLSVRAMADLERRMSMFHIARLEGLYHGELAANYDVSEWDDVEEPTPENEFLEAEAKEEAARFLTSYLAWEQFAEDVLGVTLREFLLIGTPFESAVEPVESMRERATGEDLADAAADLDAETPDGTSLSEVFDEDALGWAADKTVTMDGEELPPEDAADRYAEILEAAWTDSVPGRGGVRP